MSATRETALSFALKGLAAAVAAQAAPKDIQLVLLEGLARTPAQKNIVAIHNQLETAFKTFDVLAAEAVVVALGGEVRADLQQELIDSIGVIEALGPIHEAAHQQLQAEKAQKGEFASTLDTSGVDDDTSLETTEAEARDLPAGYRLQ